MENTPSNESSLSDAAQSLWIKILTEAGEIIGTTRDDQKTVHIIVPEHFYLHNVSEFRELSRANYLRHLVHHDFPSEGNRIQLCELSMVLIGEGEEQWKAHKKLTTI